MSNPPEWNAAVDAIRDTIRDQAAGLTGDIANGEPMLGRWALVTEWVDDDGTGKPATIVSTSPTQASWETAGLLSWGLGMVRTAAWRDEDDE